MGKQQSADHTKRDAKVMPCTCAHAYQDEKHGKGMRVHNPNAGTGSSKVTWRCSVCGSPKDGN